MDLLIHEGFSFKHILSNGFKCQEGIQEVKSTAIMSNGEERKNYGPMPKTNIKVKFGRMNFKDFKECMEHFSKPEDYYKYRSNNTGEMLEKKFSVTPPESSVIYSEEEGEMEEFEVSLVQIGEGRI